VLAESGRCTGDARYTQAARHGVELLVQRAGRRGDGVSWGDEPSSDVVSGNAGVGLFLLWAASTLDMPAARDTAVLAGRRLLELGEPAEPGGAGRRWRLTPTFERVYPNFAHGTAGVAYFLAGLYEQTHERVFLDAATAGARHLQAIATPGEGDSCLIYRHQPDATDLYYYAWCHGPAGTARLFYRLYRITGDRTYLAWTERLARGVLASGIPVRPQPGFWNVGQCCGSAGVAEFFFALYRATGRREYLDFARRMTTQLLQSATADDAGMRWVQAENRTEPDVKVAQTGLMQGASGIGLWLLRLDAWEHGHRSAGFTLPDSPF
jgi:lantibiotic modifying enzyme